MSFRGGRGGDRGGSRGGFRGGDRGGRGGGRGGFQSFGPPATVLGMRYRTDKGTARTNIY
jgi:H/ACA ribonucleoprotein complex subunit 1